MQAERADPELVRRDRLNSCHLSSVDLQPPVVSDFLGNLYTKATVLEFLLARDHGQFVDVEAEHRCVVLGSVLEAQSNSWSVHLRVTHMEPIGRPCDVQRSYWWSSSRGMAACKASQHDLHIKRVSTRPRFSRLMCNLDVTCLQGIMPLIENVCLYHFVDTATAITKQGLCLSCTVITPNGYGGASLPVGLRHRQGCTHLLQASKHHENTPRRPQAHPKPQGRR